MATLQSTMPGAAPMDASSLVTPCRSKRFGKIKTYDQWCEPAIVANAIELLEKEIPKFKKQMDFVHLSFMTDPFMMGYPEVSALTLDIIRLLNRNNIKVTTLTKGLLPKELENIHDYSNHNEYGISLVSLSEDFRRRYEPNSSAYKERLSSLYFLHEIYCARINKGTTKGV